MESFELQPPDKPLGSFLFLAPTGVGKTELTLECSRYMFGEEALHRFDEKIVFHPLTLEPQREIALIVIGEEVERYRKMRINLSVDEGTAEMLIRKGITKALGARPMKRTVQKYLGDAIRERLKNP